MEMMQEGDRVIGTGVNRREFMFYFRCVKRSS